MTTYDELAQDSLKAGSMEHGLQYSAIYWESNATPWRGFFGGFYGEKNKWSWSLVDDRIRARLGLGTDVRNTPFVFCGSESYMREYKGDKDIYDIVPTKKRFNFSFFPTGTRDVYAAEKRTTKMHGADAFNEILTSAFKVDLAHQLSQP
mmetsp:Transcript_59321/g.129941  ORF Transcript_59321/g.129941 Transcript_59321/m.129941 type:complete len:149 (+) Transcript_59321:63-509(+)